MDYKKINEVTKDLWNIQSGKLMHRDKNEDSDRFEVYDVGLKNGLFIKIKIVEDSYGQSHIEGLEFVQAQEKVVIVYEYKNE